MKTAVPLTEWNESPCLHCRLGEKKSGFAIFSYLIPQTSTKSFGLLLINKHSYNVTQWVGVLNISFSVQFEKEFNPILFCT